MITAIAIFIVDKIPYETSSGAFVLSTLIVLAFVQDIALLRFMFK